MKMNSYITRAKLEDVAHTSGYAKTQNGASFGASGGGRTFAQRQSVDYRNSRVGQYSQSILGRNDMTRRGAVLQSVESTRKRILDNRQIREENSESNRRIAGSREDGVGTGNRRSSSLKPWQVENSTRVAMRRSEKKDFSGVTQSGMAGFHVGGNGASSAPATSSRFFNVKPKF
ncbi:MAG: hypothetical protein Q4A21_02685 [bacterium]|nr:hypothetical protein [bacterium]